MTRRLVRAGTAAAIVLASAAASAQSTVQADRALTALEQKDCAAASEALKRGMADNEARSFQITGRLAEAGPCVQTDLAAAATAYERAALMGDAESARRLAVLHARGAGVPQSYAAAGRWYGVMRQDRAGSAAPAESAYAAPDVVARTYVDAVHDLAAQRITEPGDASPTTRARFDPRTGNVTVVDGDRGPAVLAAYQAAIAALPKPALPESGEFTTVREVRTDELARRIRGGAATR